MASSEFDTEIYRRERIAAMRGEYAWAAANVADMTPEARTVWQQDFRRKFDSLLRGSHTWIRPPLDAIITETIPLDGYRRETVSFATRPGLRAFGYFLTPDDCPPGRAAIVCLPGHGVGVDGIVGIANEAYQANFALQCVRRGYPTFALELPSFGHRRDEAARAEGPNVSSCRNDSMAALMLGETLAGWRVWDVLRTLDYLETRTDVVDPARLAVMGISGGGLAALFAAALDTRIAACIVSGYFNTFAASILSVPHCPDNFVPGLLNLCEMPDLAALVAPRALWVENGTDDPIFPIGAFRQAVSQAHAIYTTFGATERFGGETFPGDHHFHGVGAFAFLT